MSSAWQQRRPAGEPAGAAGAPSPARRRRLPRVTSAGSSPESMAPDLAEQQQRHRARARRSTSVIDIVGPGFHPRDETFRSRARRMFTPAWPKLTCSPLRPAEAAALRERHHRHQGLCDSEIAVVAMRASSPDHVTIAPARCPLQLGVGFFSNSHRPSSQDTFRVDTPLKAHPATVDPAQGPLVTAALGALPVRDGPMLRDRAPDSSYMAGYEQPTLSWRSSFSLENIRREQGRALRVTRDAPRGPSNRAATFSGLVRAEQEDGRARPLDRNVIMFAVISVASVGGPQAITAATSAVRARLGPRHHAADITTCSGSTRREKETPSALRRWMLCGAVGDGSGLLSMA